MALVTLRCQYSSDLLVRVAKELQKATRTKSKRHVYKFVSQFFPSLPAAATSHLMNKRTGRAASNYSYAWCSLGYANTPIDPA